MSSQSIDSTSRVERPVRPKNAAPRSAEAQENRVRVPAPLAWLLVAVVLLGLTWALLVPAWQTPDENSHFAYVQSLGERFDLPGDGDRQIYCDRAVACDRRPERRPGS